MSFLAVLVSKLINIYSFLLLVRIILSWVRADYRNAWVRLLVKLTEPFLEPFRTFDSSDRGYRLFSDSGFHGTQYAG